MEFDDQLKPKVFNPRDVIKQLDLEQGMMVADLGCGTGFLTFEAAKSVGIDGLVYAVDIQQGVISVIESGKKLYGIRNIETIIADLEVLNSTGIEDETMDYVFLATILYQVKKRESVVAEAKRILKPDGKILLFDWRKQNISFGPIFKMRFGKEDAKKLIAKTGLGLVREVNAGDFHYGLILQKSVSSDKS